MKDTYLNRKKSYTIKWLMKQDNMPSEVAAEALGVNLSYFNNKLNRNAFSFEDIIRMAYAAEYEVQFIPILNESKDSYTINVEWYFQNEEILNTLKFIRDRHEREKLQQYHALKAELAKMKEQYGFED